MSNEKYPALWKECPNCNNLLFMEAITCKCGHSYQLMETYEGSTFVIDTTTNIAVRLSDNEQFDLEDIIRNSY